MITEKDLQEAIAECEGQRNPNANTCIKLAAFYTIKQHMFPSEVEMPSYSYASPSEEIHTVTYQGNSEFAKAINGLPQETAWEIMDDLMSTLMVVNPKLYSSILRRMAD